MTELLVKTEPFRFHQLLLAIILQNKLCIDVGVPRLPIAEIFMSIIDSEPELTKEKAEEAVSLLHTLYFEGNTEPIPVVICPDLGKEPKKLEDVCCQIEEGEQAGCDSGSGTLYRGKTNGIKIWLAHTLADSAGREGYPIAGMKVASKRSFTTAHEFGHILYYEPTTKRKFDALRDFYWEAASALSQEERKKRVLVSENDFHELAASVFALQMLEQEYFNCKQA